MFRRFGYQFIILGSMANPGLFVAEIEVATTFPAQLTLADNLDPAPKHSGPETTKQTEKRKK